MPTPRKHAGRAERQRAYRVRCRATQLARRQTGNIPGCAPLPTMPSHARWRALIQEVGAILQTVREEMEAYRDARSEAWQESERAEAFQERIDQVEEALASIEAIG